MRTVDFDTFLTRAVAAHGTRFDYSRVEWKNASTPVLVGCDGEWFWQKPSDHMKGKLPVALRGERIAKRKTWTTERFISEAKCKHGDRFDYSKTAYAGAHQDVVITCPEHGDFSQRPAVHLRSGGCPACGKQRGGLVRSSLSAETFVLRANAVHGGRYDYSRSLYLSAKKEVLIGCPAHGFFSQTPDAHVIAGSGCPDCGRLQAFQNKSPVAVQEIVALLASMGVEVVVEHCGFDLFLPEFKIAIEHQGLYWHSTAKTSLAKARSRHLEKRLLCEGKGWRYVAIYEDEWLFRRGAVEAYLTALVGKAPRAGARAFALKQVSAREARAFYDKHHLLGAGGAGGTHMALVDGENVVACMTVGRHVERRGSSGLCLSRFCTDGRVIAGAASRLFNAFCIDQPVYSYVDLDKFTGGVYEALGFTSLHDIAPDYWTIKGRKRQHKTATKRSKLKGLPGFVETESEFQNTQRMGLFRIYHSGRRCVIFHPNAPLTPRLF